MTFNLTAAQTIAVQLDRAGMVDDAMLAYGANLLKDYANPLMVKDVNLAIERLRKDKPAMFKPTEPQTLSDFERFQLGRKNDNR